MAKLRERFDLERTASKLDDTALRRAKSLLVSVTGKGSGKGGRTQEEDLGGRGRSVKLVKCWKCGQEGHTRDECAKKRKR